MFRSRLNSISHRGHDTRRPVRARPKRSRRGFTLLETAMATIILGTGVLAIVQAQQYFYQQNGWSTQTSTATFLASEVRELLYRMPRHDPITRDDSWGPESGEYYPEYYDDLDDFDGVDSAGTIWGTPWAGYSYGPINSRGREIPDMQGWFQKVEVQSVDPMDMWTVVSDGGSDMIRVTVTVLYQGEFDAEAEEVTSMTWISRR
jgi:type II secretory pathway pseudopilin PulG